MADDPRRVLKPPFSTLKELDDWLAKHAVPNDDPQPTILAGTGGRPATREELLAFAAEHKARLERERAGE